ncbi:MAG TPA: glycerate kinase, partial [Chthoniobacterales bacterium]|nr:glycerate kinase [Chthoniobacterales bacterium]
MRFLVAPDKFKGSLAAREVAEHIAAGIRDDAPDAQIDILPVADGGEGTAEVIRNVRGGEWMTCAAQDALGRPIEARYVWLRDSAIAVIEMSAAAGIWRITPPDRDVMRANTFGVGQMLRAAVECGAREIIIGLGGSATNDGGLGMARALGFRFFANDQELTNGSADLMRLTRIVPSPESPPSRREG